MTTPDLTPDAVVDEIAETPDTVVPPFQPHPMDPLTVSMVQNNELLRSMARQLREARRFIDALTTPRNRPRIVGGPISVCIVCESALPPHHPSCIVPEARAQLPAEGGSLA